MLLLAVVSKTTMGLSTTILLPTGIIDTGYVPKVSDLEVANSSVYTSLCRV